MTLYDTLDTPDEQITCNTPNTVNSKKRSTYPLSFFSPLGRPLPTLIAVLLTYIAITCNGLSPNTQRHPAWAYTIPENGACNAGDGPPPSPAQSLMNPHAKSFRPQPQMRHNTGTGTPQPRSTPRTSRTPSWRHTAHRSQPPPTSPQTRTSPIAPVTAVLSPPPTPNITTNLLWNNISPTLQDSTFLQFSDTFDTHILTHTCPPDTP